MKQISALRGRSSPTNASSPPGASSESLNGTPGAGVPSPGSPCGVLYLAQIVQAVWNAGGVTKFDLAAPSADVTFAPGHLPATPVSVTFV